MQMDLTPCEPFVLSDSSSSDDDDVDDMLFEVHRQKMVVAVLAVKVFEDRYKRTRQ